MRNRVITRLPRLLAANAAFLTLVLTGAAFGQVSPPTARTPVTRNLSPQPQSKIAFVASRDIYVIHPDGTGLLNLTNDAPSEAMPGWSPDGSKLAFCKYENSFAYLYVVDADGKNLRKVFNDRIEGTSTITWSPDGTALAFGGDRGYLYRINLDGTGLRQLTDFSVGQIDWGKNNRIVFNKTSPGVMNHPNPMFTRSAWMQIFSLDPNRPALAEKALNGDSSGLAQLTRGGVRKLNPYWSPDGAKIAFIHLTAGGVVVAQGNGSQPESVGDGWHHAWSRDGRKVAFVASEGSGRLFVSADGGPGTRLTMTGGAGSPAFSPDGQQLAYAMLTGPDSGQLMVIPASGGTPRPLLPAGVRVQADTTGAPGYVGRRYIAWSPVVYDTTVQTIRTTPPATIGAQAGASTSPPGDGGSPSPRPTGDPSLSTPSVPAARPVGGRILLVDDDWSENNANPTNTKLSPSDTLYRSLLQKGWQGKPLPFDVHVVANDKDGPSLDALRDYDLVLWYNGASYGGNPDNRGVISGTDEANLRAWLGSGDKTLILVSPGYINNVQGYVPSAKSNEAKWEVTESLFLKRVIGVKGGRGLISRFAEAEIRAPGGELYVVSRSPIEAQFSVVNPDTATALFSVELNPDAMGKRFVPTATVNRVGVARCVYVGFTLENLASQREEVFQRLLAVHFQR
jgi:dipeptidyl aminopeptidase/acylaminoacyl peptidase